MKNARAAVVAKPGDAGNHTRLIAALAQEGRWAEAVSAWGDFTQRLPNAPNGPALTLALANALYDGGRLTDAARLYTHARPRVTGAQAVEAAFNLGCCQSDQGAFENALAAFADAARLQPDLAPAWGRLAPLAAVVAARAYGRGDHAHAIKVLKIALVVDPAQVMGWVNAGPIHLSVGGRGSAQRSARISARAVMLAPLEVDGWLNHTQALMASGAHGRAGEVTRRLLALNPASANGWRNLGAAELAAFRYDAALAALDRGLTVADGEALAGVQSNRGVALMSVGRTAEAVAAFRAALALTPADLVTRSNLCFCLCFDADSDPAIVFEEHRAYGRHAKPMAAPRTAASPNPDGRLRIGYVSPDFQRYPGPGYHFLAPLITHHDRDRFSITCYHADHHQDATTMAFRQAAERWREVAGVDDAGLARLVADDGIDILVDCGGHMSRTRIAAFATRMAPLQVSFPVYPNTTGLETMDYQFGGAALTPSSVAEFWTEALVRLPEPVLCYRPAPSAIKPAPRPPSADGAPFTFASFNNLVKLDAATITAWAEILLAVPDARLTLKWRGLAAGVAARILAAFAVHGIDRDRLTLIGSTPDPYEAYPAVDLCLAPLFSAGGTTTCDSLWMGVPVLNMVGRTVMGRASASFSLAVGLETCVTRSPREYVERAVWFAREPSALLAIRDGLRAKVEASPMCDERGHARAVERAYTMMWERYLAGVAPASFDVAAS